MKAYGKYFLMGIPLLIGTKIYFSGGSGLFVSKIYVQIYTFQNKNKKNQQKNKTILITGGNEGIGLETVRFLALDGANVIIASRNEGKANKVIEEINKQKKQRGQMNGSVTFMQLDLGDLNSIWNFITQFKSKHNQIDTLINNAGGFFLDINGQQQFSQNNYEKHWAVNYLGPFYLTLGLLNIIKDDPESRIINVSSRAHLRVQEDWSFATTAEADKYFLPNQKIQIADHKRYGISKLCNILFTNQLKDVLAQRNSQVKVYSLHPGVVRTAIGDDIIQRYKLVKILIYLTFPLVWLTTKSQYEGSMTTTHLACTLNSKLENGGYYVDSQQSQSNKQSHDKQSQKALWNNSIKLLQSNGFHNLNDLTI